MILEFLSKLFKLLGAIIASLFVALWVVLQIVFSVGVPVLIIYILYKVAVYLMTHT